MAEAASPSGRESTPDFTQHLDATSSSSTDNAGNDGGSGPTLIGKLLLFVGFPLAIGVLALYFSYLQTLRGKGHEISLDQDFILPFLLALAFVVIIGFQTGGFREKSIRPLVKWPKVRRVKKIVHKVKKKEE